MVEAASTVSFFKAVFHDPKGRGLRVIACGVASIQCENLNDGQYDEVS